MLAPIQPPVEATFRPAPFNYLLTILLTYLLTILHSMSASSQLLTPVNPEFGTIPRLIDGSRTTVDDDCEDWMTFSQHGSCKNNCTETTENVH